MNKKAIITIVTFLGLVFCFILIFQACIKPDDSKLFAGKLTINIVNNTLTTQQPDIALQIVSYDIVGNGPNGDYFAEPNQTESVITKDDLKAGEWTISVNGKNAAGTVIGSAARNVTIIANTTTTMQLEIIPLTGIGSIYMAVNCNPVSANLPGITSYDFDAIPAIDRDQPVVFTIRNIGGVDLYLTGNPRVAISGANASSFTVNTTETLGSITPGGSTTFTLQFAAATASNSDLNASLSIPYNLQPDNPYSFTVHCTDKGGSTMVFTDPGTYNFSGSFTGKGTITLCGGAGGGGGGGGARHTNATPPYIPESVAPGFRGGAGGGGYGHTESDFQFTHGTPYRIVVGSGGNGGSAGAVNANGGPGNNGGASNFLVNLVSMATAAGGNAGGGGATDPGPVGTTGSGGTCTPGGPYGSGGAGYTYLETIGTPPYQTTQTAYYAEPGIAGTAGSNGSATIEWIGFTIP